MKRLYTRTSREIRWEDADPALREAVLALASRQLPDESPFKSVRGCIETRSERQRSFFDRLLGRDTSQLAIAVITVKWLFTAITDGKKAPAVLAHRLAGLEVVDYARTDWAKLAPDNGIRVTGFGPETSERRSYFFGLGPEESAQAFREKLARAVEKAH